ncbi:hypothetical protein J1N35_000862 [Gossypium stocksii]|uniref:Uncharacterized protein n=1 Tax=Gossypium stocksii TaxID=47602 RepID=A0A9D4ALE5_9ROSI|nr:hypothetical protein J1N35_000862 [Gossypium stocksii]
MEEEMVNLNIAEDKEERMQALGDEDVVAYVCRLGHGKGFCPIRLMLGAQEVVFGWDSSLRASPRRPAPVASCWLREDPGDGVG